MRGRLIGGAVAVACFIALWAVPVGAVVTWAAPVVVETGPVAGPASTDSAARAPWFQIFDLEYRRSFYKPFNSGNLSRASKIERLYNEDEVRARTVRSWGRDYLWTNQADFRRTDDRTVSLAHLHDWQTLSLVSRIEKGDRWDATFGNILPNYQRYTFTTSLQGLTASYRIPTERHGRFEISATGGRTQRDVDEISFTRWGTGGMLGWTSPRDPFRFFRPVEEVKLRGTGSSLYDDPGSIDFRHNTLARVVARAGGGRVEARIRGGWNWDAEYGWSGGQSNIRTASPHRSGGAFSTNLSYARPADRPALRGIWRAIWPVSSRYAYESVSDDYFAPQASAGSDLERYGADATYEWASWATFASRWNRNEDNARSHRHNTNRASTLSYDLRTNPLRAARVRGLAERLAWIEPENFGLSLAFNRTASTRTDFTRISRVEDYGISSTHRWRAWSFSGNYGWQLTDDDANSANDRRAENWSVAAGRSFRIREVEVNAGGGYRHSYDALRNKATSSRTQGPNATLGATFRDLTLQADWSMSQRFQNVGGRGSRTHDASTSLGWRGRGRFEGLDLRLTGRLNDIDEDVRAQNFTTREARCDVTYKF